MTFADSQSQFSESLILFILLRINAILYSAKSKAKSQTFKFNLKYQCTLRLKHIVARYLAEPVGLTVTDSGPQHVAVGLHRFSETETGTAKAVLASHMCQQSSVYFLLVCVGRDHSKHTEFPY